MYTLLLGLSCSYYISQPDWNHTKLRMKFYNASLASLFMNVSPCFLMYFAAEVDHSFYIHSILIYLPCVVCI